ncbi:MAG: response regulator [Candidatus Eisenbacteria bacterium]|uniref:Response regulator n=1 Tax=Eiseniibacteriota bacterium TaxID=2212470 RepID=A0A933WC70_UNCEI|nr:response regulator [Candidatus Eisenbacteria bacterium]
MKCLVVDDSAITRRILVNSLRMIGFSEIVEACDGKQALELCDATVNVVLTDWNMPGMAGVELVRNLRANPSFAKLPVVLVTSRNFKEDVVEAANAGIDGYIVKPITPEILKAKLDELLHPREKEAE